ncbi:DUF3027 domain-containing protein [Leucobacter albus]|uniref:DUF3027 domain-containing protein n=1 Tax=Leucobacter albus TaxID=272210 RepID=A0ABW3TMZ6_9MICO
MSERGEFDEAAEAAEVAEAAEAATVEAVEIAERATAAVELDEPAPAVADPVLLSDQAREQARAALGEITDAATIGVAVGHEVHDARTVTLFFESTLAGYPGWRWAAALARVDAEAPVTVLEVELLPGEGAMLAPEWVPWSERLAQYRDAQSRQARQTAAERAAAEEAADELAEFDDADEDALENDYADFDDDLDGVDLDESELDESDLNEGDNDDDSDDDSDDR